jgi:hypothetical protein
MVVTIGLQHLWDTYIDVRCCKEHPVIATINLSDPNKYPNQPSEPVTPSAHNSSDLSSNSSPTCSDGISRSAHKSPYYRRGRTIINRTPTSLPGLSIRVGSSPTSIIPSLSTTLHIRGTGNGDGLHARAQQMQERIAGDLSSPREPSIGGDSPSPREEALISVVANDLALRLDTHQRQHTVTVADPQEPAPREPDPQEPAPREPELLEEEE